MDRLCCVIINRSELEVEHQLDADVLFLLNHLYLYGVRILNLEEEVSVDGMRKILMEAGQRPEESLLIAARDETLENGRAAGLPTLAFVNREIEEQSYQAADIIAEGFEEVDYYFLERIYQRKHGIPWRVIETERTYLREMTEEDVDALYEIYGETGMTRFVEPLYEDREEELAYTRAYMEHMYKYYGYGMWLVCDRWTDRIIGRAGLNNQRIGGEIELEMGYLIRQDCQRQGYATEICAAILDYAREALEFPRVNCLVEEENKISAHLLENLGFFWKGYADLNGKNMKRYVYLL